MKFLHSFFPAAILIALFLAAPLQAAELNTSSTLTDTMALSHISGPTPAFAPSIDDLPLMPGLAPVAGENTLFIVPHQGRIADSTVTGMVDVDDVYNFYRRSLPQLGWKAISGRAYVRGNEQLRIDAHADGKVTTVRFSVKPK